MNDAVWISQNSWNNLVSILKNVQVRQTPGIAYPEAHLSGIDSGARLTIDLPDNFQSYNGPFCVSKVSGTQIRVWDPCDTSKTVAGDAWINGDLTEISAETITVNQADLNQIVSAEGTVTEKTGYVCLTLDNQGTTSFKIAGTPTNRPYDGPFAVDYKNSHITVRDGADSAASTAGKAFINGSFVKIPKGNVTLKSGYLCLVLNGSGRTSFSIVSDPETRPYDGPFAVDYRNAHVTVRDGADSGASTAGKAFINHSYKSVPTGTLSLKSGVVCLCMRRNNSTFYAIVNEGVLKNV